MSKLSSKWSPEEDEKLRHLIDVHGAKRWALVASLLGTKGGKQCRRRWKNFLNVELKKGGWSKEEDQVLMEGHRVHGNKWTEIAKMVGGRTDNAVKNRYAALCKQSDKLYRNDGGGSGGSMLPGMRAGGYGGGGYGGGYGGGGYGGGGGVTKVRGGRGGRRGGDDSDEDGEGDEEAASMSGSGDEGGAAPRAGHGRGGRPGSGPGCGPSNGRLSLRIPSNGAEPQHVGSGGGGGGGGSGGSGGGGGGGGSPNSLWGAVQRSVSPTFASAVGLARSVLASTGALIQPALSRLNPFTSSSSAPGRGSPDQQGPGQQQGVRHPAGGEMLVTGTAYGTRGGYPPSQQQMQYGQSHQASAYQYIQQRGLTVLDLDGMPGTSGQKRRAAGDGREGDGSQQQHKRQALPFGGDGRAFIAGLPALDGFGGGYGGLGGAAGAPVMGSMLQGRALLNGQGGAGAECVGGGGSLVSTGGAVYGRGSPRRSPRVQQLQQQQQQQGAQRSQFHHQHGVKLEAASPLLGVGPSSASAANLESFSVAALMKRPTGLSIAIPHASEAEPPAPSSSAFRIQVLRECLTPAEEQHITELNAMNLPVTIQVMDDPPLTSCRAGLQQSMAALLGSPGAARAATAAAAAAAQDASAAAAAATAGPDSPSADWMSALLDLPTGRPPLHPGPPTSRPGSNANSPSKVLTRSAAARAASSGSGSPSRLGLLQGQGSEPSAGTGSGGGRGAAARGAGAGGGAGPSAAAAGGGGAALNAVGVGPAPSPNAIGLMTSLAGLHDGHKQLLTKLLTGVRVTEQGLTTTRQPGQQQGQQQGGPATTRGGLRTARLPPNGLPSSTGAGPSNLNPAQGTAGGVGADAGAGSLISPAFVPLDVLMTPHMSMDELSNIMDFLESPRK